jgi:uncharacterized protein (TIGR02246 family)
MKPRFIFAAVVFALTALVRADDKVEPKIEGDHSAEDVAAIQKVVSDAVDEGWGKFDVAHTMAEYTPGAYWINAFGIEKEGKEEIEKFVTRIFGAPGMRNRKQVPLVFKSIRFIRPDIALVHTRQDTTDQLKADGTPEGDRKSHVFRIMLKQGGKWLTDSFQVMDEKPGPRPQSKPIGN